MRRILASVFLICLGVTWASAQDLLTYLFVPQTPFPSAEVSLIVPEGTVLQVVLDDETRVKKPGQAIRGRLVEPVYAIDREVIPVGSEIVGRISAVKGASGGKRFLAALSMNFSPPSELELEFDEIILPDGTSLPVKTVVTDGSGRPLQLITTADNANKQKRTVKDLAVQKMKESVLEAKQKWDTAMEEVKTPGRMRRLGRFALAQLPVHPQYIEAGTVYFAELQEPLDFGRRRVPLPMLASEESPLPACTLLAHAQLRTPLDSGTTPKDAPVEAIVTEPLFAADRLIVPQGSRLMGSVVAVESARSFKRNGLLRIGFNELILPDGFQREVTTSLEGIQAGQADNARLDLEGGTQPTSSRRRYFSTGVAVGLAISSYQDSDVEDGVSSSQGGVREGAAGGAAAFKLVGAVAGAVIRSQSFSLWMGLFGAGRSVYSNFLARGREVVFPKGTAMEVGLWFNENCIDSSEAEANEETTTGNPHQGGSQ